MVVSFKKTAECQYRRNDHYWSSLGHRRLRFSFQINDFKDQDRKNRPHCLAPVSGGGGDVVASEVCVKNFFWKRFLGSSRPGGRRRRRFSRLRFPRQAVLLKELLSAFPTPWGVAEAAS